MWDTRDRNEQWECPGCNRIFATSPSSQHKYRCRDFCKRNDMQHRVTNNTSKVKKDESTLDRRSKRQKPTTTARSSSSSVLTATEQQTEPDRKQETTTEKEITEETRHVVSLLLLLTVYLFVLFIVLFWAFFEFRLLVSISRSLRFTVTATKHEEAQNITHTTILTVTAIVIIYSDAASWPLLSSSQTDLPDAIPTLRMTRERRTKRKRVDDDFV